MMDPLPDICKAFSLVIQQERQMNQPLLSDIVGESQALALNTDQENNGNNLGNYRRREFSSQGKGRNNRGRGNKLCTHCHKTNHTVDICYFKHGFPPGYQSKGNTRTTNMALAMESNSLE